MLGRTPQPWPSTAAACALLFLVATPVKLCKFVAAARPAEPAEQAPGDSEESKPKRTPIAVAATLPQLLPPRRAAADEMCRVRPSRDLPDEPLPNGAPASDVAVVAAWRDLMASLPRVLAEVRTSAGPSIDRRLCGRDRQPTGPPRA